MIYIDENSETVLPKKYRIAHNFCVEVYDMIVEVVKSEKFRGLYKTEFKLDNEVWQLIV